MTKKTSTPMNPPCEAGMPTWKATTSKMATARSPSTSGRKLDSGIGLVRHGENPRDIMCGPITPMTRPPSQYSPLQVYPICWHVRTRRPHVPVFRCWNIQDGAADWTLLSLDNSRIVVIVVAKVEEVERRESASVPLHRRGSRGQPALTSNVKWR